jgi:hypothetical protein
LQFAPAKAKAKNLQNSMSLPTLASFQKENPAGNNIYKKTGRLFLKRKFVFVCKVRHIFYLYFRKKIKQKIWPSINPKVSAYQLPYFSYTNTLTTS